MLFFIPFPGLNFGIVFFSFPSLSRIMGMFFFHSLPVPELREWVFSIPFPFPNFGNGIIHSRSRSRTPKCHSRSPLILAQYCRQVQVKYLQVQYWHTVTTLGVGIGRSCREVLAIEEATLMHLVWCKWKMSLEGRHDHTSESVWQGCYCSRKLSAMEVQFSKWFAHIQSLAHCPNWSAPIAGNVTSSVPAFLGRLCYHGLAPAKCGFDWLPAFCKPFFTFEVVVNLSSRLIMRIWDMVTVCGLRTVG